jgi:hypothetical protein
LAAQIAGLSWSLTGRVWQAGVDLRAAEIRTSSARSQPGRLSSWLSTTFP